MRIDKMFKIPEKPRLRRRVYRLHLYVGLILGVFISLVSFSGSLVVYKPELEKIGIAKIAFIEPQEKMISLDTLYKKIQTAYPDYSISNIVLYGGASQAINVRMSRPEDKVRVQAYINQYTGEVLGADAYDDNFLQWVYDFHSNLFLGKTGMTINSILGFLFIFLIITGLFMAFPSMKKLKSFFRFYTGKRLLNKMFDMHRLVGVFLAPVLLLIAFTGAYWGFKSAYHAFFEMLGSGPAIVHSPLIKENNDIEVSLDDIVIAAKKEFPSGTPTLIFFPKTSKNAFSVRMYSPGDYERTGSNHIYISPTTGEVVGTNLWKEKRGAEKLTRAMYFLHFGTFWGHFSRILWVLMGLAVPFLYFSGFMIWWNKKVIKKRKK